MDGQSLNVTKERIESLKVLFPDIFSEDKIDYERLRQALGEDCFVKNEHYELSWAGKSEARREIQRQTAATLIPDRIASVGFDHSENVFIEGENLEVLRVLQRSYFGRIKMIYIDPPYNTGNDSFVYPDDYAERLDDYQIRSGDKDPETGFLNKQDLWRVNRLENGHFHSAWLSMMYPRLFLARNLMREDGIIFVSIDDHEVHSLRLLMDEIFGEENFIGQVIWKSRRSEDTRAKTGLSTDHEYLITYRRSESASFRGVEKDLAKFNNPDNDPRGPWRSADLTGLATRDQRPNLHYDLIDPKNGGVFKSPNKGWRFEPSTMKKKIAEGRILFPLNEGRPRHKLFLNEMDSLNKNLSSVITLITTAEGTKEIDSLLGGGYFSFPKPSALIKLLVTQVTNELDDEIVLDFFAGSATTAQAVMELNAEDGGNRKFILVQMPEPIDEKSAAYKANYRTIADISRERLRRVIQKMELKIAELDVDSLSILKSRLDLEIKIAELKEKSPELFDSGGSSKVIQKLVNERDRLEEQNNGNLIKLDRLKQTPKTFRAFRLAPSNFNVWRANVTSKEQIGQLLLDYTQSDKVGGNSERMLYEFLLKKGFSLTSQVEALDLDGIEAYSIENGKMLVLLNGYNQAINDLIIETAPKHVVCLDRLFEGNDEALTNLHLDLRDRGIELSII